MIELCSGRFAPLLAEARRIDLDVQIREDYLNFYHRGLSILALSRHSASPCYRARIHWKFLDGVHLPHTLTPASDYRWFDATPELADAFVQHLPVLLANASTYAGPEAVVEQAMISTSNHGNSPVAFVDRQVQVHGVRKKIDLVGLTPIGEFTITELKQGLDNRIQYLMDQISNYYTVMADPDGCLREDVARSYRKVVEQKRSLGLLPGNMLFPNDRMQVTCLLVLYGYNPRSELLPRLRQAGADSSLPVALALLPTGSFTLPPTTAWELLCRAL